MHLTGCHPTLPWNKSELIDSAYGRPGPPMDLGPTHHPHPGSNALRGQAAALLRSAGSAQGRPALNNTGLEWWQRAGSITPQHWPHWGRPLRPNAGAKALPESSWEAFPPLYIPLGCTGMGTNIFWEGPCYVLVKRRKNGVHHSCLFHAGWLEGHSQPRLQ